MDLQFLPDLLLNPIKPCVMICGLNGQVDWARDALRRDLAAFNIIEQEQFVPLPKQGGKDKSGLKQFSVSLNWLEDFSERFILIIELFILGEAEMDAQLVEDITFAAKYANEFKYEHVAVVCCDSINANRLAAFKKDVRNLAVLLHSSVNTAQLINQVQQISSNHYKEVLVKKYKKRMQMNNARFLNPWQCRSFYSFKCAIAFQAAGEYGNALREYHSSYTAIIEEGNQLVAKGEGKRGLCEYTRTHADIILLRMIGCMIRLGSGKEAAAFLRGHLRWYAEAFGDQNQLMAWEIVLYCHYGWIMELYGVDGSKDPVYCPSIYFSQAIRLACILQSNQGLSQVSIDTLNQVAMRSVQLCEAQPHRSLRERLQMVNFLYLTHQHDMIFHWIDQCLSVTSLESWKSMAVKLLEIAVALKPTDIRYCWQLASVTKEYQLLERALAMDKLDVLDVGILGSKVLNLSASFDRLTGVIGKSAVINLDMYNDSPIHIPLCRIVVSFADGHQVEKTVDLVMDKQIQIHVDFLVKGPVGEHSIESIQLYTSSFSINSILYKNTAFECENNKLTVIRPKATLVVKAEPVIGVLNTTTLASLVIDNQASKPVQGVIKVTKVPVGLDIAAAFPFGVSANGTNTVKLPMSASGDKVDGELLFDIDFTCEHHDCEPMTDLAVPILIDHPVDVTMFRYRRVKNIHCQNLDDLFETMLSVSVKRKPEYTVSDITIQVGDGMFTVQEDSPIIINDAHSRQITILINMTGGKRHSIDLPIPNLPYRPSYGLITKDQDAIVVVNEHIDPITTVVDTERKGQIFINGPKRLTLTLPPHTFKLMPISVTSMSNIAQITMTMDGQPACPEWLKCD